MEYQEEIYLKGLSLLYGKDYIPTNDFRNQLKKEFGLNWHQVYNDLDGKGFFQIEDKIIGETAATADYHEDYACSLSVKGNICFESLSKKKRDERKQSRYNKWTLGSAIVAAIGTIVTIILMIYYSSKH